MGGENAHYRANEDLVAGKNGSREDVCETEAED